MPTDLLARAPPPIAHDTHVASVFSLASSPLPSPAPHPVSGFEYTVAAASIPASDS